MTAGNRRCVIHASLFEQQYMLEMVHARRSSGEAEERYDLFSGLLDASYEEVDNGGVLNDDELIGEHSNVVPVRIPRLRLTSRPRKHVYLPCCRTRGGDYPLALAAWWLNHHPSYRPRPIHFASHLACWHSFRMNKSGCINI
jgi:hypothetical protein